MTRMSAALIALIILLPVAAPAAPGDPPFELVAVTTRVARLGQQRQIEAYFRKLREAEFLLKVEGLTEVYAVAEGGRAQTFVSMRTLKDWHERDTDTAERHLDTLTRAFGADEAATLSLAMAAASESVTTELLQVAHGLSNWHASPSGRPWPYMQVRRNVVKPGMQQAYRQVAARIREVRLAANRVPELRWSVVEGPGNVYGTTRYFRGWQDRALWDGETTAVLGDTEAATLHAAFQATIERTESVVLRHRPDLSRHPLTTSDQQH